mmetsp:Transcript_7436/g.13718  ORF Transcript_7436/g.13718 Transcript_7436/m.13718 type:complete len:205 (-) Transcript_7436:7-621(-)
MQRQASALVAPNQGHGSRAATVPSSKHRKLAVDLLKGISQRLTWISLARCEPPQLGKDDLVKFFFYVVHLVSAPMSIIHRKKAPAVVTTSREQQRVHNFLAVLHVISELLVGVLRKADKSCSLRGDAKLWRSSPGRDGDNGTAAAGSSNTRHRRRRATASSSWRGRRFYPLRAVRHVPAVATAPPGTPSRQCGRHRPVRPRWFW